MGFAWDDRRCGARRWTISITSSRAARGFHRIPGQLPRFSLVLFTSKATLSPYDHAFAAGDILLFGKESAGVPAHVAEQCVVHLRIPMRPQVRSLNLATSAALAVGEALRQTGGLPVKLTACSALRFRDPASAASSRD
jgi:tRNA (cytidine/uridine-2'-O-)-methyltransferase